MVFVQFRKIWEQRIPIIVPCSSSSAVFLLQVRAEWVGMEGEGKEGGDEWREGLVPAGSRRRLLPRGLLPLPVRHRVRGGGFILVRYPAVCLWISEKISNLISVILNFIFFKFAPLSLLCSYEVQLESRVRRKGLGKFLIQILQLIANR